jgi:hypothetical protein
MLLLVSFLLFVRACSCQKCCCHCCCDCCCDCCSSPTSLHTDKNQSDREGSLVKTFKWTPGDPGSYLVTLVQRAKEAPSDVRVTVALSAAEFYTLSKLLDSSFFYLLGWDAAFTAS